MNKKDAAKQIQIMTSGFNFALCKKVYKYFGEIGLSVAFIDMYRLQKKKNPTLDFNVYLKETAAYVIEQKHKKIMEEREEQYKKLSESGELCNYCPIEERSRGAVNQHSSCEGSRCSEAFDRYLEEMEGDEDGTEKH